MSWYAAGKKLSDCTTACNFDDAQGNRGTAKLPHSVWGGRIFWEPNSKAVDECFETAARVIAERHTVTDDDRIEVEFEQHSHALP